MNLPEADPASLTNLREAVIPEAVSWWPLAPGWWVLLALLLAVLTWFGWIRWKRWRRNAYRREALEQVHLAETTAEIATLLKRTALSAFPRENVATLTGPSWVRFLRQQCPGLNHPDALQRVLEDQLYSTPDATAETAFRKAACDWIRHHERNPSP